MEQKIEKEICNVTGISNLFKKSREVKFIDARSMYVKYLRDFEGLTFQRIAESMGNPSHATPYNLYKKFNSKLNSSKFFKDSWDEIMFNMTGTYLPKDKEIQIYKLLGTIKNQKTLDNIIFKIKTQIKVDNALCEKKN